MSVKFFRKVVSGNDDVQRLQANVEQAISEVLKNPILDSVLIESVRLSAGNVTQVSHKLSRIPKGYILVSKDGPGDFYLNSKDASFLNFISTTAVNVSILVF
jgi:hypothetical protein